MKDRVDAMHDSECSTYPADMAAALRGRWAASGQPPDLLPSDTWLSVLLDRMYQASLMREESEPVQCRIIVAPPSTFEKELAEGASDLHVLRFTQPAAFTAHDLRKLAAAAGYYRALLAVRISESSPPAIWGMVITGTQWVNHIGAARVGDVSLPANLVIQILGPGHLVAASGHIRVLESAGGKLLTEGFDPFQSTWLPERFSSVRGSLLSDMTRTLPDAGSTQICDMFVRDVAQSVLRRVLNLVRTRGHGGLLVFLPDASDSGPLADRWFRFRVRFADDDSVRRYRRLMVRLMMRVLEVGSALGLAVCTWNDYRRMHDAELAELDDALIEFGHFLADLMSVDGAVVLDRSFRLIGFGGEILGDNHVKCIDRALDLEAARSIVEAADAAGTRHRAAYRLVNGSRDAIAVVVSQDGDVRFVAHHNDKLSYWPYLP